MKAPELGRALRVMENLHRKLGDEETSKGLHVFANLLTSQTETTVGALSKKLRISSVARRADVIRHNRRSKKQPTCD